MGVYELDNVSPTSSWTMCCVGNVTNLLTAYVSLTLPHC